MKVHSSEELPLISSKFPANLMPLRGMEAGEPPHGYRYSAAMLHSGGMAGIKYL